MILDGCVLCNGIGTFCFLFCALAVLFRTDRDKALAPSAPYETKFLGLLLVFVVLLPAGSLNS